MPNNQETICEYKYTLTYVYKDSRQMISTEVYVGHRAFKTKIMGSNIFWIEKDNKYAKTQELVKSKKKDTRASILSLIASFRRPR